MSQGKGTSLLEKMFYLTSYFFALFSGLAWFLITPFRSLILFLSGVTGANSGVLHYYLDF